MSDTDKILKQLLKGQEQFQKSQEKMQEDISLIKTQQKEHGEILSSLKSASEFHKADIDNLTHQVAEVQGTVKNLSDKMDKNFSDLNETNKSLLEMYGEHEAEIRTLRRKPV
jgi:predicted  nucleic acid-binding Zn-ribbon protein